MGDVPLFGNLFKSEARTRKKTNLMVFLRPVVVRDAGATERLSVDRYDMMRSGQRDGQPVPSRTLPINEAAVLPALSLKSPASASASASAMTPVAADPAVVIVPKP